ncbi:MAG: 4-hydroxythreonine-4-phosphate dehydrogenase [Campylobacterales bacterium]|nr:4-hydroxythreonine-4-phosphate dehydrogenase [Campylobacterales bacterium]
MSAKIAISIGDYNGVGPEIALRAHPQIALTCTPLYCCDRALLEAAAKRLHVSLPDDLISVPLNLPFEIRPGVVEAQSGVYSYASFMKGVELCEEGEVSALVTLPIHKEAWAKAGLSFVGHTDALRRHFKQEAIMMLGCESMYVALFTEHIPLREVALHVSQKELTRFLMDFVAALGPSKVGVLGLNPHAGDHGVLGDEERAIEAAIAECNAALGAPIFEGPLVPDVAFTPRVRAHYRYFVAMYHDQGLAPLKALYFDESINVSLGLPIVRTSVDHGTAFDIAYQNRADLQSYLNAVHAALDFSQPK